MSRKIVQIATCASAHAGYDEGSAEFYEQQIVALCDDGSVWWYDQTPPYGSKSEERWHRLPPIPEEDAS